MELPVRHHRTGDETARQAALDRYGVLDTPAAEPFDRLTALVRDVLRVPISAVSLIDRERQWFKSIQGIDATETPRSLAFCAHTIEDTRVLFVPDAEQDHRFSTNPLVTGDPYIRSYAGAPLRTPDGYNIGALCAIDTVPRVFTPAQLGILTSFATLVVDELELRQIAERDHLTGALSRRGFVSQMDKAIARFRRDGYRSVLILLDIDHFKSVNDRFGHPAGDAVLQCVSAACAGQLRTNDSFGRLGGEEFGILVTDVDERGGIVAAEQMRRLIEDLVTPAADGIRVTASFGLTVLAGDIQTAQAWLAKADRGLYTAKMSGRNKCIVASPVARRAAA